MKHVSTWATALRASDLADASLPLFACPRKIGSATAARMPMMRMTTSSSMSVKPAWSSRVVLSMVDSAAGIGLGRRRGGPEPASTNASAQRADYHLLCELHEPLPGLSHERA